MIIVQVLLFALKVPRIHTHTQIDTNTQRRAEQHTLTYKDTPRGRA